MNSKMYKFASLNVFFWFLHVALIRRCTKSILSFGEFTFSPTPSLYFLSLCANNTKTNKFDEVSTETNRFNIFHQAAVNSETSALWENAQSCWIFADQSFIRSVNVSVSDRPTSEWSRVCSENLPEGLWEQPVWQTSRCESFAHISLLQLISQRLRPPTPLNLPLQL